MVGEVTDKKSHVSNAALLAILGVLIILIIALIIGVVVHNTINTGSPLAGGDSSQTGSGSSGGSSSSGSGSGGNAANVNMSDVVSDTEDTDSLVAIHEAINNVFAETGDVDATIAKYEEAIAAAQEKNQRGMEYQLYLDNAEFMIKNDRCDNAMEYLNAKDLNGAGTDYEMRYYSAAVGMSIECQNTSEQASWQSKLDYVVSLTNEGLGW